MRNIFLLALLLCILSTVLCAPTKKPENAHKGITKPGIPTTKKPSPKTTLKVKGDWKAATKKPTPKKNTKKAMDTKKGAPKKPTSKPPSVGGKKTTKKSATSTNKKTTQKPITSTRRPFLPGGLAPPPGFGGPHGSGPPELPKFPSGMPGPIFVQPAPPIETVKPDPNVFVIQPHPSPSPQGKCSCEGNAPIFPDSAFGGGVQATGRISGFNVPPGGIGR